MRSIGTRLTLAFLCVVFFLLIQGVFAIYNARIVAHHQRMAIEKELAVKTLKEKLAQTRLHVFKLIGTMDPWEMDVQREQYEIDMHYVKDQFVQLGIEDRLLQEHEKTYDEIIRQHYDFYVKTARELINSKSKEEYESLYTLLEEKSDEIALATQTRIKESDRRSVLITIGLCAAALFVAFVWAYILKQTLTDRRRAEKALQERETLYRTLFESLYDGVLLLREGGVIDCNEQACRIYGTSREELMGKRPEDFSPPFQPDGRCSKEKAGELIRSTTTDSPQLFEWKGLRKDGTLIDVEVTLNAISIHGKDMIQNTIRDVTDRRKAEMELRKREERFRALTENISDITWIFDSNGILTYTSPSMRSYGYSPDEIVGSEIQTLIHPQDVPEFLNSLQQSLRYPGESIRMKDFRLLNKEGVAFLLAGILTCLQDLPGVEGIVFTGRDITEKRKMEEELLKSKKLESIGILAGGIAHDFNNLLMAILGNISLAKTYSEPKQDIFNRLTEAEKASLQAQNLTQQLLTFSKGGAPLKECASLQELVKETVSFTLSGSKVRCEYTFPKGLWNVDVDKGQFSQVIHNLILNADQAMPEGGTIGIEAANVVISESNNHQPFVLEKGQYVSLTIRDEGVGISSDYLPKIFDPYFTTKQKGSGLGLATTYSIINKHGGAIFVESELKKGTTFHIYLPASMHVDSSSPQEITEPDIVGSGRILIMDDEEFVRDVTVHMVNRLGYEAEVAKDGDEAVSRYKNALESGKKYDAVIMDLTIPGGMGGKEAIQHLLEVDPDVKAIVSSGYSGDPIMSDYQQYGFTAVLTKPYQLDQVGNALNRIVHESDTIDTV